MRITGKTPWLFATALGAAVACGGVSDENFYDGPAKRVTSKGGGAGVGAGGSVGGSAGQAPSAGGSTGSSGGSVATVGGSSATGGDTTGGGSGGSGNVSATGGSGDAPAAGGTNPGVGGTEPGVGGTMGDAGAGDAPSSGTGGDVSAGGMGGSSPMAGTGGMAAGMGGTVVGGAGGAGAGAGGKATGGRGGRGGADCQMRLKQIADKLTAAQACDRADDENCLGFVDDECGCPVPVNNPESAATKAYRAAIEDAAGCIACTALLCVEPNGARCQDSGPGDGHCVTSLLGAF